MGHPGEDKGHRTADGLFPIPDHANARDFQLGEPFFDLFEQGGQVALSSY